MKKEENVVNNVLKKEKTWAGDGNAKTVHKNKMAQSEIQLWNFEFMTMEDENPNIMLTSYLKEFNSFRTKSNLDKILKKNYKI